MGALDRIAPLAESSGTVIPKRSHFGFTRTVLGLVIWRPELGLM